MNRFPLEPFKNWFGYTRRERRSSFILLLMIFAVAGIRFVIPEKKMPVEIIPLKATRINPDTLRVNKPASGVQENRKSAQKAERESLVDLNQCDSASLEALPGIGPVLSVRIIKYRNLLGGYATVDQLREVYGLSEETFNMVASRLKTDPAAVRKININTSDFRQLIRMPYFEKSEVSSILKYRELAGKIRRIEDLIDNKIITKEKADKVRWYLEF